MDKQTKTIAVIIIILFGTVPIVYYLNKELGMFKSIAFWDKEEEQSTFLGIPLSGLWGPVTTFQLGGEMFSSRMLRSSDPNWTEPFIDLMNPQDLWLPLELVILCENFGGLALDSVMYHFLTDRETAWDLQLLIGSYKIFLDFELTAPDNSTYSYAGGIWKFITLSFSDLTFVIPSGLHELISQNGTFYLDFYMEFNVIPSFLLSLTGEDIFNETSIGPFELNFTK